MWFKVIWFMYFWYHGHYIVSKEVKTRKVHCDFMRHWFFKSFLWTSITNMPKQIIDRDLRNTHIFGNSLVSLLSGGTGQPENTYSCICKVTGLVLESQKRTSININHSYHQHSYCWISLNWSNDSDSVLTKTIAKR